MTLQASGAISLFDVNDELGLSHSAQIGLLCTNVRTLFAVASGAVGLETGYSKSNTSVPGVPTGVSASASTYSSASVSFSAPACTGHLTIDYYQAISSPGCFTATGTSPISVTGLSGSTSYTFRVRAHNSKGYGCYSSSSGSITTPSSTYSISAALVAGGGAGVCGGGGAGGVIKSTSLTLTIGTTYTITVGSGARNSKGTNSSVGSLATAYGGGKSSYYQCCRNGGSGGAPSSFCTSLSAGTGVPGQGNNSGGAGSYAGGAGPSCLSGSSRAARR